MLFISSSQDTQPVGPSRRVHRKIRCSAIQRSAARSRPRLELLEDRMLLTGVSFSAPYTVPQAVGVVAVADFNNDGKADLVAGNDVLLGNADGTFQAGKSFIAAADTGPLAVGDLNGDGKADLVLTNPYGNGNTVSVLLGKGDGTFQTAQLDTVGSNPDHVALGDFNGDGKLDIAVTDYVNFHGVVSVLLGNGDGTFRAAQSFPDGHDGNGVGSLAVGDFNGDGKADVVVALISTVSELLGNGDGTLQAGRDIEPAVGDSALGLTVGDLNGDGKPDVIVANPADRSASVLLCNGDGTFQTARDYVVGSPPVAVVVGDFDGDGKPDLATVSNDEPGSVSVVLGNGDGTFRAAQSFAGGALPSSLATGDFNGDHRLDLAVTAGDSTSSVSVLLNARELSATAVNFGATAGALSSGPVATFTSAYPAGSAASYSATINWGDGSVSPGIVTGSGTLIVSGSHTYIDPGMDTITVVISGTPAFPATGTVSPMATVATLGQGVQAGLTGDIAFWHGKSGEALIKGFNGGPNATALSSWLAGAFPNLYGANADIDDLAGQTNTQVAAFFKSQAALPGSNVEAQVLATALNVYATTLSLGGTVGQTYGFSVSADGLGADSFNVGADGAAFGVAKKTTRNVYELLMAVNRQAVSGSLYNDDPTLQKQANHLFHALIVAGAIS